MRIRLRLCLSGFALLLTMTQLTRPEPALAQESPAAVTLYAELGENAGISQIVDHMLGLALQDARIKDSFRDSNLKRLAALIKEQFCVLSDGPCRYSGDGMKETHAGLQITSAQFNALAEDLQIAMEQAGIPSRLQNRLIARLAPMKRDIVHIRP